MKALLVSMAVVIVALVGFHALLIETATLGLCILALAATIENHTK